MGAGDRLQCVGQRPLEGELARADQARVGAEAARSMTRCSVTSGWQPSYNWLRTAATKGSSVERMPPRYTASGLKKLTLAASTMPR